MPTTRTRLSCASFTNNGASSAQGTHQDANTLTTVTLFDAKDDTWVFGYQFMAGITFPIADGISMSVAYRYFQTQDFVYTDVFGEEFETDITQQSGDITLQFHL